MRWFTRSRLLNAFRRTAPAARPRFRPGILELEARTNPTTTGYVTLGTDLMFYGEYDTLTNPAGGTDYTFIGEAQLGWNPPNEDTTAFQPLYTYESGGSLMFNSEGNAPVEAPTTSNGLPTGQDSFILNGGNLLTVEIDDVNGNVLYPSFTVESGLVQYVGVNDFVNGGLSLQQPKTFDFGKYLHLTIDSIGFGTAPVLNGQAVQYDPQLAVRGAIVVGTTGTGGTNVEFDVNGTSYVGIASDGLTLTGVTASVSGSFSIDDITVTISNVGLGYSAASGDTPPQLTFFGKATASFADAFNLSIDFGSSNDSGLIFDLGTDPGLEKVQFSAGGSSDLDGVKIEFNALTFEYLSDSESPTGSELYAVGGGVEVILTKQLTVEVELGTPTQPGLQVSDGSWVLDGFAIKVANMSLPGGWGLKDLQFSFETDTVNGGYDISGDVEVKVPAGFSIGGGLGFVSGSLSSVEIDYDVSEGEGFLRLPGTGLYISSLHGSLENLNQLSDLQISAAVSIAYGPTFTLPGSATSYEIARANVTGSFSSTEIYLSGGVYFLSKQTQAAPGASSTSPSNPNNGSSIYDPAASGYDADNEGEAPENEPEQNLDKLPQFQGVLGSGNATISVNLAESSGIVTANASLADGIIRGNFQFTIDDELDVYSTATLGAYFPQAIPIVGGSEILGAGFEFKWDGDSHTGFVAAATNVLETDVGFKYDIESYTGNDNDFSIIYSGPFAGLFTGTTTYTIDVNPSTLLGGSTAALYAVDYQTPGQLDALTVTDPNGNVYTYSNGSFGNGLISVQDDPPANQVVFSFAGSTSNAYESLPAGNYVVKLTTKSALPSAPGVSVNASITAPTVSVGSNLPAGSSQGLITVPVLAQAGAAVQAGTTITLYADQDAMGYDGIPVGTATMPAADAGNPGAQTPVNIDASFRGLLPIRYHLYAVIDDGTNAPVTSAYSNSVQADQEIFGQVTNSQTSAGIPGMFLWIDANGNGDLDPPIDNGNGTYTVVDPVTWTSGTQGAFSFPRQDGTGQLPLTAGQQYTMYLDLPDGFTYVSSPPPYTGTVIPAGSNRPARVSVPFTYNPGITVDFSVQQAPTIAGTVLTSISPSTQATTGLQGVKVYVDLNNNGQYDSGTEPSTITDGNGQYRLLPLTAGTTYTVALDLASNQQLAANSPGSRSVTLGTTPITTAPDFNVVRYSAISGNVSGYALSGNVLASSATNLSGWTVQLYDATGATLLQTTTTDANGDYSFQPVAPTVSYQVRQVPPSSGGWRQITPQSTAPTFTFQAIDTSAYGQAQSVATADFNEDGVTDYAVVIHDSKVIYFWVSTNTNGVPGYEVLNLADVGPGGKSAEDNLFKVAIGDYFGDGTPSVFIIDRSNYVYILKYVSLPSTTLGFNIGDFARVSINDVPIGTAPMDLVVADFDGDGHDDFAMSSQGVDHTQNDPYVVIQTYNLINAQISSSGSGGTHGFSSSETWLEFKLDDNGAGGLAAGYVDGPGDAYADLFANVSTEAIYVFGQSTSTTTPPKAYVLDGTSAFSPGQVAAGFVNSDVYLDAVLAFPGLGSGTPQFGPQIDFGQSPTAVGILGGPTDVHMLPLVVVDLNLDGLADLGYLVSGYDPAYNEIDGSPTVASPLVVYTNQFPYGNQANSDSQTPYSTSLATTFDLSGYNISSSSPVQATEVRAAYISGFPTLTAGTPLSSDAYPDLTIAMLNSNYFLVAYNSTIATPNTLTVTAPPTSDVTGADFTNAQIRSVRVPQGGSPAPVAGAAASAPGTTNAIGGVAFDDANRSGEYEPADEVRAGVSVYLDLNGDGELTTGEPTRVTNEFGAYVFGGLENGTYTVRALPEANRKATSADSYTVTLADGLGGTDADFGSVVAKDIVVHAPAGAAGAKWVVTQVGPFVQVLEETTNTLVVSERLTDMNSFKFVGNATAADELTIDFNQGGRLSLPGGIYFAAGANPGDTLRFNDGAIENNITLSPGSARIDGLNVTWGGTTKIDIKGGGLEDTVRVAALPGTVATAVEAGGVTTVSGLDYELTVREVERLLLPTRSVLAVGQSDGSVRITDAVTGADIIPSFRPLDANGQTYSSLVSVALGDWNGDGVDDLFVAAANPAGSFGLDASKAGQVFVYDGVPLWQGVTPTSVIRKFVPFASTDGPNGTTGAYVNGLNIAVGDVNADGKLDLVAGSRGTMGGFGNREYGRFVAVDGNSAPGTSVALGGVVKPFGTGYEQGVVVAAGNLGGTPGAEVAVTRGGAVNSPNPLVQQLKLKAFRYDGPGYSELNLSGTAGTAFAPFGSLTGAANAINQGGRITLVDSDNDGTAELVFSALDPLTSLSNPQVRVGVYSVNFATGAASVVSTGPDAGTYLTGSAVADHAISHAPATDSVLTNLALVTDSSASGVVYLDPMSGAAKPGGFSLDVLNGGVTIAGI